MAKAVTCPVCDGKGTVSNMGYNGHTSTLTEITCHGCGGKGWVEVSDD